MAEHWFYHLEQSALEQILPDILQKTYAKGWRALVKLGPLLGEGQAPLKHWDEHLWKFKSDSFLPHSRDDEPRADEQPIVLSLTCSNPGGADVVILVGGAQMENLDGVKRCITILNGADEQDKAIARTRWKQAKDDGLTTAYWRQDDYGKWEQPFK